MGTLDYEILIRRAFKCDRYGHPGADMDIWNGLVTTEWQANESNATQKDKNRYEKELKKVKDFIGKAFDAAEKELIKRKAKAEELVEIKSLKIVSDRASNTNQLSVVIGQGLEKFKDYKIDKD
jgi:hypothetical protein